MYKLSIKTLHYLMTLLIAIALVIPLGFVVNNKNHEIQLLKNEKIGTLLVSQLQKINILLAEHRGTSNMYLNGNQTLMPRLQELHKKAEHSIENGQQQCMRARRFLVLPCEKLAKIKIIWESVDYKLSAPESFAFHTSLITEVYTIQSEIADYSNLSLDSMLSSYYLMNNMTRTLPDLIEKVGQLRGFSSGILAEKKRSHMEQMQLIRLSYAVRLAMEAETFELKKVFLSLPEFGVQLNSILLTTKEQVSQLLSDTDQHIIYAEPITLVDDIFFKQATQVINMVMNIYRPVVATLNTELNKQIAILEWQRNSSVAGFLIFNILVISFISHVIRRINIPLKEAQECFKHISEGNFNYPIKVTYQDEISCLFYSLIMMRNQLAEAQRIGQMGNWDWDIIHDRLIWSDEVYRIFGFEPRSVQPSYTLFLAHIVDKERKRIENEIAAMLKMLKNGNCYVLEYQICCADGSYKQVSQRCETQFDEDAQPIRVVSVIQDITGRKQAEAELRIAAIAFEAQEGIMVTDTHRNIIRVNKAFTAITGYTPQEIIGKNPKLLQSGRHVPEFYTTMWESIHNNGTWEGEIWNRRKTGEIYPEYLTITAVKDKNDTITHYVAIFNDITLSRAAADEIERLAFYDPLTHLPNRRLLYDRLKHALAASHRNALSGGLLFIDMDNFKNLNDTLGHEMGDLLLIQIAERLVTCVRENDTVARLGGDEFIVLIENLKNDPYQATTQIEVVGKKILSTLNQPYSLKSYQYRSTPSIGAVLFSGYEVSAEELLKQADIAMYQAKAGGRNTLRFFNQHMQAAILTQKTLKKELH